VIIYITSIFLVDYFADSLAFEMRGVVMNFFNGNKDAFAVKRFLLWDIGVELGFFTIVCTAFVKYPRAFFFFNDPSSKESLSKSLALVLRNCVLTSLVLILFFALFQGLLFWIPRYAVGIYVELSHPEIWKNISDKEPQYDYFGHWLKLINFSLIFILFIRAKILTTLVQRAMISAGRTKLHPALIFAVLFSLLLCISTLIQFRQYQEANEVGLKTEKSEEEILPIKTEDIEPNRAHITVYDPSTGKIISND
jgi:hypothetical protein